MDTGVLKLIGYKTLQQESFYSDTMNNVGWCPYLIIEFIVKCHKSKFTEKFKGCQIMVLRD